MQQDLILPPCTDKPLGPIRTKPAKPKHQEKRERTEEVFHLPPLLLVPFAQPNEEPATEEPPQGLKRTKRCHEDMDA